MFTEAPFHVVKKETCGAAVLRSEIWLSPKSQKWRKHTMRFDRAAYGARIKQLRLAKGLTQEQLAERMNITRTYIAKLENGTQTGPVELAVDVAVFFDVSLDLLLLGKEYPFWNRKRGLQNMIQFLSELEAEL